MATGAGSASPSSAAARGVAGEAEEGGAAAGLSLRRKLLAGFFGLGLMALLGAGVTYWTTARWVDTNTRLQDHYSRSLAVQRIRSATFRAFKEIGDALALGDDDALAEFREALRSTADDFARWTGLADTEAERAEVAALRAAFDALAADGERALALFAAGDTAGARGLLEDKLEAAEFDRFAELAEAAVRRDRERREGIRAEVLADQRTARIVLAVASFGAISLALLLAAYLASDLFRPLREVERGLADLGRGDGGVRLDEARGDELGAVNAAFNRLAEGLERRRRFAVEALAETAVPAGGDARGGAPWRDTPSRLTLHNLVARLHAGVSRLRAGDADDSPDADRAAALDEVDALLHAVGRLTEVGFPLDLELAPTDLRALVYETAERFHDEIARRHVSLELDVAAGVGPVVVDRLKVREAVAELVRNALASLPAEGGRLGLRLRPDEAGGRVLVEVADDGPGMDEAFARRAVEGDPFDDDGNRRPRVGLALTRAIAERHGGDLRILSRPGQGTVVRLGLPLRP